MCTLLHIELSFELVKFEIPVKDISGGLVRCIFPETLLMRKLRDKGGKKYLYLVNSRQNLFQKYSS